MKTRELRALDDGGLAKHYEDLKVDMHTMRLNKATGELKDTAAVRRARHELARVLTILRERELAAAVTEKDK
jgi:large subunit ribosomal protein L29